MKSFMKRMRIDYAFSSIMCIVLGVLFILYSDSVFTWLSIALAVIMIAIGIILVASVILDIASNGLSSVAGGIMIVMGIALLILKDFATALVPIVIGVVTIAHGIRGIKESVVSKKYESNAWGFGLITSLICVIFGVVCIINAFGVLKMFSILFGIGLIFNGVTNLWIANHVSFSERRYNKNHPIDVEFIEDAKDADGKVVDAEVVDADVVDSDVVD